MDYSSEEEDDDDTNHSLTPGDDQLIQTLDELSSEKDSFLAESPPKPVAPKPAPRRNNKTCQSPIPEYELKQPTDTTSSQPVPTKRTKTTIHTSQPVATRRLRKTVPSSQPPANGNNETQKPTCIAASQPNPVGHTRKRKNSPPTEESQMKKSKVSIYNYKLYILSIILVKS